MIVYTLPPLDLDAEYANGDVELPGPPSRREAHIPYLELVPPPFHPVFDRFGMDRMAELRRIHRAAVDRMRGRHASTKDMTGRVCVHEHPNQEARRDARSATIGFLVSFGWEAKMVRTWDPR